MEQGMKPSSRRRIGKVKSKLPKLFFTFDELFVLKKALVPLEKRLLLATDPQPNLQLARETVTQVKGKITRIMLRGNDGAEEEVEFDANEVLMMQTAIWIF